ncbi:MAG: hypothetical protein IT423_19985 [Pirellulaceae bacterium]|nr:hypothetical protein [Pirellulaceae bacterium]
MFMSLLRTGSGWLPRLPIGNLLIGSLLMVSGIGRVAQAGDLTKERQVELFAAMESGDIETELIAPSARKVYLRVHNKSNELLSIKLPPTFAAVPVLAQFAPPGGGFPGGGLPGGGFPGGGLPGGGFPGGGFPGGQGLGVGGGQFGQGGGGSQGLGGGFNGGGANQGVLGNGNGVGNQFGNAFGNAFGNRGQGAFRVAPGRVGKVMAQTVCLEHGKPDPTSKIKYRIVPLDQFGNQDPRIAEVCRLLAQNRITQNVAQAAAWHVTDGLSWGELAAKDRVHSKYTGDVKFFSAEELETAAKLLSNSPDRRQSEALRHSTNYEEVSYRPTQTGGSLAK